MFEVDHYSLKPSIAKQINVEKNIIETVGR